MYTYVYIYICIHTYIYIYIIHNELGHNSHNIAALALTDRPAVCSWTFPFLRPDMWKEWEM